jgi:hypothetical protein
MNTKVAKLFLVLVMAIGFGCAKGHMSSASEDLLSPADGINPNSWLSIIGLTPMGVQNAMQGVWKSSCLSSHIVATETISGTSIVEHYDSYVGDGCTGAISGTSDYYYTLNVTGPSVVQPDGYDIEATDTTALTTNYTIVKMSSIYLVLGKATSGYNGTTLSARKRTYNTFNLVKQ